MYLAVLSEPTPIVMGATTAQPSMAMLGCIQTGWYPVLGVVAPIS